MSGRTTKTYSLAPETVQTLRLMKYQNRIKTYGEGIDRGVALLGRDEAESVEVEDDGERIARPEGE